MNPAGYLTTNDPLACITVRRTWPIDGELVAEHVTLDRAIVLWEEASNAIMIDERDGLPVCMAGVDLACSCGRATCPCEPRKCPCEGCANTITQRFGSMCDSCNKGTPNDPAWNEDEEDGPPDDGEVREDCPLCNHTEATVCDGRGDGAACACERCHEQDPVDVADRKLDAADRWVARCEKDLAEARAARLAAIAEKADALRAKAAR